MIVIDALQERDIKPHEITAAKLTLIFTEWYKCSCGNST